jgi:hypothetical protein
MNEARTSLGLAGVGVLAVVCCAGLPVILAAGVSAAVFAWAGGVAAGLLALGLVVALVVSRERARASARRVDRETEEGLVSDHDCRASAAAAVAAEGKESAGQGPLVEVLYFDGCPNHEPSLALVERLSRELGIEPRIELVNVPDQEAAQRLRFLGSPTIRVAGIDVDPRTEERTDFGLSCRIFRTEAGIVGQPDERWVRAALISARDSIGNGRK